LQNSPHKSWIAPDTFSDKSTRRFFRSGPKKADKIIHKNAGPEADVTEKRRAAESGGRNEKSGA